MQYEWDEDKNRLNQRKHGISFEVAALAFEDERCLVRLDRMDEAGEQRWHAIGAARIEPDAAVVLLVVHVYREENKWRRNHPHPGTGRKRYLSPQG